VLHYRCVECHTLASTEFVGEDWEYNEQRDISVMIGGKSTKLQTYGDLVTSIINPSHRIAKGYVRDDLVDDAGESKMRVYNDVMSVTELVDLVTFLHPQYELIMPPMMS
jgi:sulfur-oxidizing protein SoxX